MLRCCLPTTTFKALTMQLSQNIVIRYQPKRSMFDKTSYNTQWIQRVSPYSKHRKPQLSEWTDPKLILPYNIPPLRKIVNPKTYLKKIIEQEQKIKSLRTKQYILQDIRSGDIIDITYQETFQSQQKTTHRCFVLSFKRRNTLMAALQVVVRLGGMNIKAIYLIHSPKVKDIKLISKGSGNFRSNLKNKWMDMSKNQLNKPLVRNRVIKLRQGAKRRQRKTKTGTVEYDVIKSDNIKTIL